MHFPEPGAQTQQLAPLPANLVHAPLLYMLFLTNGGGGGCAGTATYGDDLTGV